MFIPLIPSDTLASFLSFKLGFQIGNLMFRPSGVTQQEYFNISTQLPWFPLFKALSTNWSFKKCANDAQYAGQHEQKIWKQQNHSETSGLSYISGTESFHSER